MWRVPARGRRVWKGPQFLLVYSSGMAAASQAASSSEDTSSSSDETDVEVIAAHPQELPSANL